MFSVKAFVQFPKNELRVMNRTRGAHDTKLTRDFSRTLVKIFEQKDLLFAWQEKVR